MAGFQIACDGFLSRSGGRGKVVSFLVVYYFAPDQRPATADFPVDGLGKSWYRASECSFDLSW